MSRAGAVPRGYAKIGDDVALVPAGRGKLVLKVDMLVEHTDVPPGMTYRQAARKAVAMCVSDFAAKGARPESFLVSLGLRRGVTQEQVDGIADGLRDAEREWDLHLVGGDTNEAEELVVDCTMVGFADRLVMRKGARPGDAAVVSGRFGLPPAGVKILTEHLSADPVFYKAATASALRPSPSIAVGGALSPFLTCAMDSSDGLARSLHTLARESGVGFRITSLPTGEGVARFASQNRIDPEKLVLEGGEEYLIVGTVSPGDLEAARRAVHRAGGELLQIGEATAKSQVVLDIGGRRRRVKDAGWTHLG